MQVFCLWIMFLICTIRILPSVRNTHLSEQKGNLRGQLRTIGSLPQFFVRFQFSLSGVWKSSVIALAGSMNVVQLFCVLGFLIG